MTYVPPTPTEHDREAYFQNLVPLPPKGTFELALTLGGTVSAGAYTAGVIDFLFEALDAWKADPDGPPHRTVLKVISGASGGAVCAAISSLLTGYSFPHGVAADNPLYKLWVDTLDVQGMLDTSDIKKGNPLPSLLNVAPLDRGVADIIHFNGNQLPARRDWLDDTLSTIVTLTNLRGVPYALNFGIGKEMFVNHADFARFQVATTATGTPTSRPDAFDLRIADIDQRRTLGECAVASGAFPIGFVARGVTKPMDHYAYGVVVVPDDQGKAEVAWHTPDWPSMANTNGVLPAKWDFACYDGGAIDNEPIELARWALNGYAERIPRDGIKTQRAVLLVDPFADPASLGPIQPGGCLSMAGPFLGDLVAQGRYDTSDLVLATQPNKYSRFLINAQRGTVTGGKAICSAGLQAFQGFLCKEFRVHDYLLGRQNAYDYLKNHLTLLPENPLFDNWSATQRTTYAAPSGELPIIPIVEKVKRPEVPNWPQGVFKPAKLSNAIEKRVSAVVGALENEVLDPNWFTKLYLWPGIKIGERDAVKGVMAAIQASLTQWGL